MLPPVVGYQYVMIGAAGDGPRLGGGEGGDRQEGCEQCKKYFHRPFFTNLQVGGALEEADG
jgi:hypothetical protein